jgi:uracil-DNA glycosylase
VRQELAALEAAIAMCERCYGPERRHVVRFARPAGPPRVLVLVERPPRSLLARGERLGPENADPGTRFLRELLGEAGIPVDTVVIGAAVMCRAASRTLESAVPSGECLRECTDHVRELIRLVAPRLILPLGRSALRSLRRALADHAEAEQLRFPESVGRSLAIGGLWVHPLYHVTLRARVTRPEERQRGDWRAAGRLWETLESRAAR